MALDKDVLTTGDVARLCGVTIRTVIKWYEQGRLQGYRLPGSRDRRFTADAVRRFLRSNDMPLGELGPRAAHPAGPRRVLVVDDDDALRELVTRYLGALGLAEIDTASSGWEAGLKTATRKPHLLLLDYRLGDTTGDKVVQTIRSMEGLEQPAIVIMSAHLSDDDARDLLQRGADGFLPKPFDLTTLRDMVLRHVGTP